ncbi:MAG: gamma-glutamylcyclotransferase [Alphaproteobacteria bacterium]|nr:MAG: gamma-glutamylcyclotransferase [Alphaproteobacteria bacterium]
MKNGLVGYFGYGSLVNRQTLRTDFVAARPARLAGFRRYWQSRGRDIEPAAGDDIALLSVAPDPGASILGMLVVDRAGNLASVDEREARYDRLRIDRAQIEVLAPDGVDGAALPDELYLYVGRGRPDDGACLLQSYLDAVMAGFLAEFGEAGVHHFLATTSGFARTVIADRASPRYPRAVRLDPATARRFDQWLEAAGARFG